jgi:hypothetical protein
MPTGGRKKILLCGPGRLQERPLSRATVAQRNFHKFRVFCRSPERAPPALRRGGARLSIGHLSCFLRSTHPELSETVAGELACPMGTCGPFLAPTPESLEGL